MASFIDRNMLFDVSKPIRFLCCRLCFGGLVLRRLSPPEDRVDCVLLLPVFSSRVFMVLSLAFKPLIHSEVFLAYGVRRWSNFIFCTYLSSFPNTIY